MRFATAMPCAMAACSGFAFTGTTGEAPLTLLPAPSSVGAPCGQAVGIQPPHQLGGAHELAAPYSSQRAPSDGPPTPPASTTTSFFPGRRPTPFSLSTPVPDRRESASARDPDG